MKTQEELNILKEEVEDLRMKLCELTDEELAQVMGGGDFTFDVKDQKKQYEQNIYTIPSEEEAKKKFEEQMKLK